MSGKLLRGFKSHSLRQHWGLKGPFFDRSVEKLPKKRFGQVFLTDPYIARRMVEESDVSQGETILEIGAGKGILTEALLEKGANLISFEIDRDLFEGLKKKFNGQRVKFIFQDFLSFNERIKVDKCVSNIPYNISTPILKKLFKMQIPSITIMIQREYAQRLFAKPRTKAYSSLSVFVALRADVKKLFDVDRNAFFPIPNVDSTVLKITQTNRWLSLVKDEKLLDKIVRLSFSHRRKTLKNNLKALNDLTYFLKKNGISEKARAEELSVDNFVELSNFLVR